MAVVSISFDGTRVNNADALGSVWTDLGGGKCASEPDFIYQGTAAVSEKVGTSEGGVALDTGGTTYDFSTTAQVWLAKHIATNSSALNNKGSTGGILEIGSGGRRSAYDRYYAIGGDTYPIKESWIITPIDPNGGNQSARPGTAPTLTAINYFGWACDFGATSKAENVAMDAVDYMAYGEGLTLVGGDGADADGTFDSFVTYDEDSAGNNRYGVVSTREGILFVNGFLNIGTATATVFTETGAVVVWPDAEFLNSVGFFGLQVDVQSATSVVDIANTVFISRGTTGGTVDTRADVTVTGTSGTADFTSCRFENLRNLTLNSVTTFDGVDFECADLTQASADVSGGVFRPNSASSVAACNDPTFGTTSGIRDIDVIQSGSGHAFEISGVGATVTLTNINFSGFGADTTNDAAIYVSAATGTTTINYSGGNQPTYRSAGATVVVQSVITITYDIGVSGVEVRAFKVSDGSEEDGVESSAGTAQALSLQSSTSYNVWIFKEGYVPVYLKAVSYTATQTIDINFQVDGNYLDPS